MEAETVTEKPKLEKYAAYKETGEEWLKEIPAEWNLGKLGSLLKPVSFKNRPDLPLLSITREKAVILRGADEEEDNHNFIPDDLSNYKVLEKGQFGMNKMKAWQGSYGVSPFTGIVSPAYYVFKFASEIEPRFFHLAIRSKRYVSFFGAASDGVRIGQWDLSKSRMKQIPFAYPPIHEQTAIANFLDEKTAKIEQAIAQKERLIALLQERKQIIIQQAVTKGLDPTVPMKDSGVEWIGEIPVGWEVRRLKYLCAIKTGSKNTEDKIDGGKYPFYVRSQTPETINSYSFDGEAILTAGDGAGVGKVYHYVNGKFDYHQRVYKFSHFKRVLGKVLFHYIQANFFNVAILGTAKSTVDSLRLPLIQNFEVCFSTSADEQSGIIQYIETQSAKIDQSISLQQRQIEQLKEYKATLIDSAVTGKVKVG